MSAGDRDTPTGDELLRRLKEHDPAELNAIAALVTQGSDPERHPLFSVRYRIAVTILESDWLRERDAQKWDEGHKAGGEDAGALTGWANMTQQPGYFARPMPTGTPNPYRRTGHPDDH